MRKFFAVAMGSAVALMGFASAANASATVDLVWIDVSTTATSGAVICLRPTKRNCPQMGDTLIDPAVTDEMTMAVILTAGPGGSLGADLTVDYLDAANKLSVTAFQSLTTTVPLFYLPLQLATPSDTGAFIANLGAGSAPPANLGIGLPAGVTAYLGTVSFHQDQIINGTSEIFPNVDNAGNGITDLASNNIGATTAFNSAWVVNVPEPGALSLLVMGLGGMLLAGRGRRS